MTTMTKRVDALEKASPSAAPPVRVIRLIVEDDGETQDAAIARWCAENPDLPPPTDADVIILRTLVSAPRRESSPDVRDEQRAGEERHDHDQ